MNEKTRATMSTIGGVLAIPLIGALLYGAYFVFTFKPKPKPPEPKVESFRADGKQKGAAGPEIKVKGAAAAKKKSDEPQVWDVELLWEVSNADEVSIEPGLGKVEAKGSRHVDIEKSTTFILKAKNVTGEITYNLDVDVALPEK
jgi:hypothetical protein